MSKPKKSKSADGWGELPEWDLGELPELDLGELPEWDEWCQLPELPEWGEISELNEPSTERTDETE